MVRKRKAVMAVIPGGCLVWISEAYKKVTQAVVKKSFGACGISTHDRDVSSCVQPGATAEDGCLRPSQFFLTTF